jgi:hypothetical protein
MRIISLCVLASVVVLTGCESTAVEDNLGKAVAQMRRDQTNNPSTLTGSQDQPVEGIDPEAAKVAVESMRKDTPERATVKRDILINVGTQNGGGNQ